MEENAPKLTAILGPEVRESLLSSEQRKHFNCGQTIYYQGDEAKTMIVVYSGSVRVARMTADGRQVITGVFGPGHCVGLVGLMSGKREQDVIANGDTTVGFISRSTFDKILQSKPEFAVQLLPVVLSRFQAALNFIDDLKNQSTTVLTAIIIEQFLESSEQPNVLAWKQEDIALAAGSSRVSVGKALKELERRDLIELGYGQIMVPDVKRLTDWIKEQRG
ncbi:Cyclic AMP receptor protein [Zhongshania aliphaticivorans]|uniref:Cyclic AMP receptor protein n=1 Tax=Zhongshania aliphaticivorans TaxID=1470434 RepID=A0A5S9N9Y4_9GAMM|nr:Crp/Fnr family transcriptional regulator [Zhongshania aliphaticivorans]CAA0086935.1 Cyclic AMP receptor protein [Zhongshania aliphaticivorans]CAA0113791.1 Cyclic AMP receptor protein [Zhongshania aliphaticivorans]